MFGKACRRQRIPQFIRGCGGFRQPQIVGDAVAEKLAALRHESGRQGADRARSRPQFTRQKLDEARLARAARADDRKPLPGSDCKVDIRQDRIVVPLPLQTHIFEFCRHPADRQDGTATLNRCRETRRDAPCGE
ncbi:hypothetical protein D3C71_956240 [compost metagenome]